MEGVVLNRQALGSSADQAASGERPVADGEAWPAADEALVRRLTRERMLARDHLAALAVSAVPAREGPELTAPG